MPTTKLYKRGNSQGILIPKKLCDRAGFQIGDSVEVPESYVIFLCVDDPFARGIPRYDFETPSVPSVRYGTVSGSS